MFGKGFFGCVFQLFAENKPNAHTLIPPLLKSCSWVWKGNVSTKFEEERRASGPGLPPAQTTCTELRVGFEREPV